MIGCIKYNFKGILFSSLLTSTKWNDFGKLNRYRDESPDFKYFNHLNNVVLRNSATHALVSALLMAP